MEAEGTNHPYGRAYKPEEESVAACGDSDRILHLWKDWRVKKNVEALLEKKLDVLLLANGFIFGQYIIPWPMGKWPW